MNDGSVIRSNKRKAAEVEPLAYSINEAARALSVGRDKVYELIAKGELRAKKAGKRTLIPRSSIEAWLERD